MENTEIQSDLDSNLNSKSLDAGHTILPGL